MKKKLLATMLCAVLLLGIFPVCAVGETTVVLKLGCNQMAAGGQIVPVDDKNSLVAPIAENGRTLVPVSRIVAAFGGESRWDGGAGTVYTLGGHTVTHTIGTDTVTADGKTVQMEVASKAMHNRTYAPVRYILEGLGLKVGYEGKNQLVVVSAGSLEGVNLAALPESGALLAHLTRSQAPASAFTSGTLIAPARSLSDMEPSYDLTAPDGVYVPELGAATGCMFRYSREDGNGVLRYNEDDGTSFEERKEAVFQYARLLESLPYFEIQSMGVTSARNPDVYAYLRYTGSRKMKGNLEGTFYRKDVHVAVLYDSNRKDLQLGVDENLNVWDVGLRTPGGAERLSRYQVTGRYAGDAYYRSAAGTYYNASNQALSTDSGKCSFLVNGARYTGTVQFPPKDGTFSMVIGGFYGTDAITLHIPKDWARSGDVFGLNQLRQEESSNKDKPSITLDDPLFPYGSATTHKSWSGAFKEATLRVLRYDVAGQGDTVLYFHFKVERGGALYDVEGLAAAPWQQSSAQTPTQTPSGKSTCTMCSGSGRCSTCGGSGQTRTMMIGKGWVEQTCTDCLGSGKCRWCSGAGER